MNIILKEMTLTNFKGIRSKTFTFNESINVIRGKNATGKTTILDAFLWCLFGKDSQDRKDFEIKTYDKDNIVIPQLDHEVEIVLFTDRDVRLKRCFKEIWTQKRGSQDIEFTGHETIYFWNDVPLKMSDYNTKISELVNEGIFKSLTNTAYFHSLHWEKRREIIFSLAGKIEDKELLSDNLKGVAAIINEGKTISEAKAEIGAKRKKIKNELNDIPSRIDEAERSKSDPVDTASIESLISAKTKELSKLEQDESDVKHQLEITNKAYNDKVNELYSLKRDYDTAKSELTSLVRSSTSVFISDIEKLKKDIELNKSKAASLNTRIEAGEVKITSYAKQIEDTRAKWHEVNAGKLEFAEDKFACPTCLRSYDKEVLEAKKSEMVSNFNKNKAEQLNEIKEKGIELKQKLDDCNSLKSDLQGEVDQLSAEYVELSDKIKELERKSDKLDFETELKYAIHNDERLKELSIKIDAMTLEVESMSKSDAVTTDSGIADLRKEIQDLQVKKASQADNQRIDQRIQELKNSETTLSVELGKLDGIDNEILQFEKDKTSFIESKINGMFGYVKFKMFETQINGGEIPCCKTIINGVPYEAANHAAKINSGLDIINTLSAYYNINCPIFVDNVEAVNDLLPTKSQLIALEVIPNEDQWATATIQTI